MKGKTWNGAHLYPCVNLYATEARLLFSRCGHKMAAVRLRAHIAYKQRRERLRAPEPLKFLSFNKHGYKKLIKYLWNSQTILNGCKTWSVTLNKNFSHWNESGDLLTSRRTHISSLRYGGGGKKTIRGLEIRLYYFVSIDTSFFHKTCTDIKTCIDAVRSCPETLKLISTK